MSDNEAQRPPNEPAGPPPASRWWQVRGYSRRTLATGAAVAAVILAAGTTGIVLAIGSGSGSETPTTTATPLAHDPVPTGRIITKQPAKCGVSKATLDALLPKREVRDGGGSTTCRWSSETDDGRRERQLEVEFAIQLTPGVGTATNAPTTSVSQAIEVFAGVAGQKGTQPVTGLGDEAAASYDQGTFDRSGTVTFRAGNAVVKVSYSGEDRGGDRLKQLPRKTALDGALTAAADVAKSLDAPVKATPATTTPRSEPPGISRNVAPCDTVPTTMVTELTRPTGTPSSPEENTGDVGEDDDESKSRTCTWKSYERALTVSVTRFPAGRSGSGTRQAKRKYLEMYQSARAAEPLSKHDTRYFTALTGPGQQAFGSYIEEIAPGRVVFRDRNVIVDVGYGLPGIAGGSTGDEEPLTRDEAVNGAYTAATRIAATLPK